MLAFAHKVLQPIMNRMLQKILNHLLGKRYIMSIFLVLGMESEHQR